MNKETEPHNYTIEKLLNFASNVNNISLEIKALQRAVAVLKPEIRAIIKEEFARGIKGGIPRE